MDPAGRRLARARLPEGVAGIERLHAMIAEHLPVEAEPETVAVGIETDRGPWVSALIAAGYRVFVINPRQVARFRETASVSGAKSDAADAHTLAEMVRLQHHQLRAAAGDSALAEGVQMLTRAHQALIADRTRHVLRLRAALREYFPGALQAFPELGAPDALELLAAAPDPQRAAQLTHAQISAALQRARRRDVERKAIAIRDALAADQLRRPAVITAAQAATVRSLTAVITTLNTEIATLEGQVSDHFGRHPDAEIYRSQPGIGALTGARVLAEFGDDPQRFTSAKARKNYAGTSPLTIASGKRHTVTARHVRNNWLANALQQQAFSALSASPGARAYYDALRARGVEHRAALRQLGNRLVGILHGCLASRTLYNEHTAWAHHHNKDQQQPAA